MNDLLDRIFWKLDEMYSEEWNNNQDVEVLASIAKAISDVLNLKQ